MKALFTALVVVVGFFFVAVPIIGTTVVAFDYVVNGNTELTEEQEDMIAEMR